MQITVQVKLQLCICPCEVFLCNFSWCKFSTEGEVSTDYKLSLFSPGNTVYLLTGCFGGMITIPSKVVRQHLVHCYVQPIDTTELKQILQVPVGAILASYSTLITLLILRLLAHVEKELRVFQVLITM